MKYARTAALFFNTPLAVLPAKAEEIRLFWQTKLAGQNIAFEEERQEPFAVRYFDGGGREIEAAAVASAGGNGGAVAVIPLHGIMSQRVNMMQSMSGGTSTQQFLAAFREQVNNPSVKAVILDVASPGGNVYGVDEMATELFAARDKKPIVAVANSEMFSAAYYSMSNASEVVITPGGELGSIGVIAMHVDESAALELEGLKYTLITAGKYKAEGNSLGPLDEEAHTEIQSQVDRYYGMFLNAVARGRGVSAATVRDQYGQGRIFGAQDAVKKGMADRVATLEDTISRFANGGRVSRRTQAETDEHEVKMQDIKTTVADEAMPPAEMNPLADVALQLDRDRQLLRR